jgi:hypothetical protein
MAVFGPYDDSSAGDFDANGNWVPKTPGTTLTSSGPDVIPPQNSTIPTNKSVGPFTGGTSTENSWDPRTWFGGNRPLPPQPAGGGFNPLSLFGGGNPYWRGAIAGAGILQPTPAETGEFTPAEPNFVRPDAPKTGGLPAPPSTQPARPVTPTPATAYPPTAMPARPVTPTPASAYPPAAAAPAAAAPPSNMFGLIDRPNASATGWNPGAPKTTALDLSSIFNHPAVAAAAAAHPAVQGALAAARPDLAQRVPLAKTPLPPTRTTDVARGPRMTKPYTYVNT